MSLLLLFAYPNPASIPVSDLVTTEPVATNGAVVQRDATSGEWRFVLELADPSEGSDALWRDITNYYAGDRHQFGADAYMGDARARLVTVQLQIDDSDLLAPWGQDTSPLFGVDVLLDAGLLMRASMIRVVSGVVAEWEPLWTGRVESWGDASAARGQIRTHVVSVIDTMSDLANVPTNPGFSATWDTWFTDKLLPQAGWLFGVDIYGDTSSSGLLAADDSGAAINRMDQGTDPLGLVWRTLRNGRMVIHPAPWDTTNVNRYDNPLLDVYPDGLRFNYSPDFTDIEYIADDEQQPFGIERNIAGVLNFFTVTMPADGGGTEVYANDDPVSAARYGIRPFTATWILNNPPVVDDLLAARAFATSQALPLRVTLDHEGFFSAMAIVDHLDPVTVIHQTQDEGLVVTGTGWIRNVVEERTWRGDGQLSWQSTVQIDLAATETSEPLLPVESLAFLGSESSILGTTSSAEFSWVNPTQPSITPTNVQYRILGTGGSFIWVETDYPGVGADGQIVSWLEAATDYRFQVRLIRRVDGVLTNFSTIKTVRFTTAARIYPIAIPGEDPTDTDVTATPPDECDDFTVELQENDGSGWVTVDTFTGSELHDNGDGTFSLTYSIPNSFFNDGSMYRFRQTCDGIDYIDGPAFDPPDDWDDPCTTPPALSDPPYDDPGLLVYVPQICAPDTIREAVSGIVGVHGPALAEIGALVGGGDQRVLVALPDPAWSEAAGGILAYGECPQIVGHVGDRTISARVNVVDAEECVLFECGGMRIGCSPTTGGWRATVTIYKVGSVTITLPTTTELDEGTEYVISATHELATGTITIAVDGITDNSVGGTDDVNLIAALPIWRVGAPPESWITDCAMWGEIPDPVDTLDNAIMALNPVGWWKLDETSGTTAVDSSGQGRHGTYSGTYTLGGWAAGDGRNYATFNGGKVTIPDNNAWSANTAGGLTVVAWIKPDPTMTTFGYIVSKLKVSTTQNEWDFAYNYTVATRTRFNWMGVTGSNMSNEYFDLALSTSTGNLVGIGSASPVFHQRFNLWVNSDTPVASTQTTPSNVAYTNTTAALVIGWDEENDAGGAFKGGIAMVAIFAGNVSLNGLHSLAVASGLE